MPPIHQLPDHNLQLYSAIRQLQCVGSSRFHGWLNKSHWPIRPAHQLFPGIFARGSCVVWPAFPYCANSNRMAKAEMINGLYFRRI